MKTEKSLHTLSILVANKPGVLVRISTIFSRRGFNIDSLVVSPTQDGRFSRMTVVAQGDPETLDQIIKQVLKLVDVLQASIPELDRSIEKELALIKVSVNDQSRDQILQLVQHFKAQTVDISDHSVVVQITGSTDKLDACQKILEKYGIIELSRTGKVLMTRGN